MQLSVNDTGLFELLKSFYTLTSLKISIYDSKYNEIVSYPENEGPFCTLLHKNPSTLEKCTQSTALLCRKCSQQKRIIIESCHAGLIEVVAPITNRDMIIGYIMFGQIARTEDKTRNFEIIRQHCSGCGIDEQTLKEYADEIIYKEKGQIYAASEILAALTHYILLKRLLSLKNEQLQEEIAEYVENHIGEELSVDRLCRRFYLSRTSLYEITKGIMPTGIASYIKERRMEYAARLLRTTSLSVSKIAEKTGISDYNYFCRIFKKYAGVSAKKYREEYIRSEDKS